MNSLSYPFCVVLGLLAAAPPAHAESDKSTYSLFNPTPAAQMREMNTDRPDLTESPYTIDAGHVQVEMDLWTHTIDRSNDGALRLRDTETAYAPFNFKIGLTTAIDLQIIVEPYRETLTRNRDTGAGIQKNHGFGDVTTRVKVNFWGNDGGDTAFGLMPFVKFPTASNGLGNGYVEGGLILPLSLKISDHIDVGLMTEVDTVRNSANTGYTAVFVNTATAGFDVTNRMGMYVELATAKSAESATPWAVTFDAGLTFALTDNIQLDTGINIGLTRAAPDLNPFIGLSWRF